MNKYIKAPPFLMSVRFLVTIMAFFGYCFEYMLKINLGIAIVCMINNTALHEQNFQHAKNFSYSPKLYLSEQNSSIVNNTGYYSLCIFEKMNPISKAKVIL